MATQMEEVLKEMAAHYDEMATFQADAMVGVSFLNPNNLTNQLATPIGQECAEACRKNVPGNSRSPPSLPSPKPKAAGKAKARAKGKAKASAKRRAAKATKSEQPDD
eukprot:s6185_g4.t1